MTPFQICFSLLISVSIAVTTEEFGVASIIFDTKKFKKSLVNTLDGLNFMLQEILASDGIARTVDPPYMKEGTGLGIELEWITSVIQTDKLSHQRVQGRLLMTRNQQENSIETFDSLLNDVNMSISVTVEVNLDSYWIEDPLGNSHEKLKILRSSLNIKE